MHMRATLIASSSRVQDVIRYDCERCKREFVLGPERRTLTPFGWLAAHATAIGRGRQKRGGFGATYRLVRLEALVRANERATEAFVASFRFCHECRRFVCPRCWSRSRRACRACVSRAMAKLPVAWRRFRFGARVLVIASSMLLLLGVGEVLAVTSGSSGRAAPTAAPTAAPILGSAAVPGAALTDASAYVTIF